MTVIGRSGSDEFVPLWFRLSVAFIVLVGVFFRFYNLDRKVFWEDEILGAVHTIGYTEAEIVAASPRLTTASDVRYYLEPNRSLGVMNTIESLAAEDPQHPPAYYVFAHLWTQRFGGSVESLRTPAAILGVLVLPCVFWLAMELFGSLATALTAVALVAISPFFVLYAQEAREYSMWTVAIALDSVIFLRAIRTQALALWVAYGAAIAISLYIYPLTGFLALGFPVYLFVRERGRLTRAMCACIVAELAALAMFAPWLKAMLTSTGVGKGMAVVFATKLSPVQIARIFARDIRFVFFDIGSLRLGPIGHSALDAAFTVIVVALCLYAFVALIRGTPYAVWGFLVVGLCLSMTPLLMRDLFVRGEFVYQGRYFLPLLLGTVMAVAALFGRVLFAGRREFFTRAVWGATLATILAGEALSCATASQATTWWNKDNERAPAVAALVNSSVDPLVVSNYFTPSILELSLYLDPAIPMRLSLECAQCRFSPHAPASVPISGFHSIFVVQASAPAGSGHYRWIDPKPYPGQMNPFDMFSDVVAAQ